MPLSNVRPVLFRRRLPTLVVLLSLTALSLCPSSVVAAQPAEAAQSLAIVPNDVAFYSATLRNKEKVEIVANSDAWAELNALPAVQMGKMFAQMAMMQPDSPWQKVTTFFEEPENQRLLELIKDMVSDEIFVCGMADCSDVLGLVVEVNNATQFAPLTALARGETENANRVQAEMGLKVLLDNLDRLQIPNVVTGFRTTQAPEAGNQLDRLETLLQGILEQHDLASHLKRESIGSTEYLTLRLDGSLLPWEELNRDDFPLDEADFDKLIDKFKSMTLVISIGVYDEFVIVSIGNDNKHLESLGGTSPLAKRPELQRLAPHADKRVTGVTYTSRALLQTVSNPREQIDGLAEATIELLPKSGLSPEAQQRARADIRSLATELKQHVEEPGALVAVSMMNSRGIETFTYNWGEHDRLDGSRPLTLLNHVGGQPLLAIVSRATTSPEDYESMVKWLVKAHGYVEEIILPKMDEDDRQEYREAMDKISPLLVRLDKVTGSLLLPALADGQNALVVDAKITSRQWHERMPEAKVALPMIEPALVLGVSDASRLEQAIQQYREILGDAVLTISELSGQDLPPDFKIPEPEVRETAVGKVYVFDLPAEAGLDNQIAPSAGLSETVAVLTSSPDHAERLLSDKPIDREGPIARADKPLYAAVVFDFAGLVDAAHPWIEYAMRTSHQQNNNLARRDGERRLVAADRTGSAVPVAYRQQDDEDPPELRDTLNQVSRVMELLKVFRGYRSVTYDDDGVTVTHGEVRLADIP